MISALSDLYSHQVLASGNRPPWSQMCLVDWREKLPISREEQCDKHHYTKEGYGVYMSALQDCVSFSFAEKGFDFGQNGSMAPQATTTKHLAEIARATASQPKTVSLAHQNRPMSGHSGCEAALLAQCYPSSTHGKFVLPKGRTALALSLSAGGRLQGR